MIPGRWSSASGDPWEWLAVADAARQVKLGWYGVWEAEQGQLTRKTGCAD